MVTDQHVCSGVVATLIENATYFFKNKDDVSRVDTFRHLSVNLAQRMCTCGYCLCVCVCMGACLSVCLYVCVCVRMYVYV